MPTDLVQESIAELVLASRILAGEGIVDSFGHVSVRHPQRADRYLMPCVRAAELVRRADILEFDLDDRPHPATERRVFIERAIHGAIYRARPDVLAVCHHHAPAIMPFCASGAALIPVFHLGATMGQAVPHWDSQADFGDTNLLVATSEQGDSLAHALGANWTVLMRGHGATVVGRSVKEAVFRSNLRSPQRRSPAACHATWQRETAHPCGSPGSLRLQSHALRDRARLGAMEPADR